HKLLLLFRLGLVLNLGELLSTLFLLSSLLLSTIFFNAFSITLACVAEKKKEVRQGLTPDQAEKVKEVYDEITKAEKKEPKENNMNYDRLSKQEKLLYAKLEELDEIKRGLYSQEVNRVEKLFENRYKQGIKKEPKLTEKDTKLT
ncbi:hypothetical protein ACUOFC_28510, partial [Escherichia sp. TWPC-MK]